MISVDPLQLFVVLFSTMLLQEFLVKPIVDFLKRHYHKGKSHIEKWVASNGNNH